MDNQDEVAYLKQDRGAGLRIMCIVMIILPTIATALRFGSRALLPAKGRFPRFWWDDWIVLATLVFNYIFCALAIKMISLGAGRHVVTLTADELESFLKDLWVAYFFFDLGCYTSKISALFYYSRMFSHGTTRFRYSIYVLHMACFLWVVGLIISAFLECRPLRKVWKPSSVDGTCSNTQTLWLGNVIPSLIIDVAILMLPVPIILRLKMQASRKALSICVIACGYLVVIVSIGRLVAVVQVGSGLSQDPTWYITAPGYWLCSEIAVTIISICLPSIFFLLRHCYSRVYKSRMAIQSQNTQSSSYTRRLTNLEDLEQSSIPITGTEGSDSSRNFDVEHAQAPHQLPHAIVHKSSIMVQRDFVVQF